MSITPQRGRKGGCGEDYLDVIVRKRRVYHIMQDLRGRAPSKSKRTSQSSMLDSCAQLSQSTDSTKCTSWKEGDSSGTSSSPSETKDDSRGRALGRERVATRIADSGLHIQSAIQDRKIMRTVIAKADGCVRAITALKLGMGIEV